MSLLALAAAYDSYSGSNDSETDGEIAKGEDHVLGKEMKQEMGDAEEMVKTDGKKIKEQNPEESFYGLVLKEEPKDEYGELEQIPGSSFGAIPIKREPKEAYSEFGIEAGGVCKIEPKVELEEEEVRERKDEFGKLEAGIGKQEMQGPSFGEGSLKRELKEEYSEFESECGYVCKKEPKVELEEGDSEDKMRTEELPGEIFEKAKQLKHHAVKAECVTTKVQSYLSSIQLFIKSYLVTNNKDVNNSKVLKQTHNLTKLVYKLCVGKATSEELAKYLTIYAVLVLRAQSLIECHLRQQNVDNSNGHPAPPSDPTWNLADQLVSQSDCIKDLYANLDKECGSLTQQSSLGQLVGYLEMALQKLPRSP